MIYESRRCAATEEEPVATEVWGWMAFVHARSVSAVLKGFPKYYHKGEFRSYDVQVVRNKPHSEIMTMMTRGTYVERGRRPLSAAHRRKVESFLFVHRRMHMSLGDVEEEERKQRNNCH